jgi:hypothetical protein
MKDQLVECMDGVTTKYYFYKSRGSGSVTIPVKIAEALNWEHKQDISLTLKTIDGEIGIFLKSKNSDSKSKNE